MNKSKTSYKYAEIAPAIPLTAKSPQTYTYQLPEDKRLIIQLFNRVKIPFGKRTIMGTIINLHNSKPRYAVKKLVAGSPAALTAKQVTFAGWLADTMQGGLGYTLRLFQPPGQQINKIPRQQQNPASQTNNQLPKQILATLTQKNAALINQNTKQRSAAIKQLTARLADKNKQTLIIVPEKWMADTIGEDFIKAKSGNQIAILHGDKKTTELTAIWHAVKNNDIKIIIGTQKALFLPFNNLGLIVIEEEFYQTHKLWDQYPRLHNIDGAKQLARIHKAPLLYSSSFPSIRLRREINQKSVKALKAKPMSVSTSVDNFTFDDKYKKFLIPGTSLSKIHRWLRNNEKILLFYNRRGSWQYVGCHKCHQSLQCPNCNVALTVHKKSADKKKKPSSLLSCHHCGTHRPVPAKCPRCRSKSLFVAGMGGEHIENIVNKITRRSIIRVDTDTRANQAAEKLIKQVQQHQITLGTSAIFTAIPGVKFDRIIWLFPERDLLYPDYRSNERALYTLVRLKQLLNSSRRKVLLVTRQQHLIGKSLTLPVDKLIDRELKQRKRHHYPPFNHLVRLTISAATNQKALNKGQKLRKLLDEKLKHHPATSVHIKGPFQSFIPRHKGKHEAHITLTGPLNTFTNLYDKLPIDSVDLSPERIL